MEENRFTADKGKNEKEIKRIAVRPEAIRIRKDEFFKNARSQFPKQPLESLQKSIQDLGLLKQLCVERDPDDKDKFILLAGERRLISVLALKKANADCLDRESGETAPASVLYEFVEVKLVTPKDDLERLAIMLAENGEHSQVPDWDYFNFALWLDGQTNEDGSKKYSRKDLCKVFNKSAPWVSHTLSLANLPPRAKKCLQDGTLSRTAAVHLLSAKEEKVEFVLKYAESVVVRNAQTEIEEARQEQNEAEIEAECAELQATQAANVGDRIQARLHARRGTEARRKLMGATHREERARNVMAKPVLTEEAIKQTLEERPETLQEGVAPKARSTKRVRDKVKNVKTLLDEQCGKEYILNSDTGREYPRGDVEIVVAAYEQVLGKKPLDVFALLDEEYEARQQRSKKGVA